MCLTARCTNGRKGRLLKIVQKVEEDEDEGEIMCIWNVYVLNIYLLALLQVLCKWIAWIMNKKQIFFGGNQISFHFLKENIEEEIVLRDNMAAQDWAEDIERCGNEIIVLQQWRKDLEVLYTFEQMKVTVEEGI